jgi:hypothetical protein
MAGMRSTSTAILEKAGDVDPAKQNGRIAGVNMEP